MERLAFGPLRIRFDPAFFVHRQQETNARDFVDHIPSPAAALDSFSILTREHCFSKSVVGL